MDEVMEWARWIGAIPRSGPGESSPGETIARASPNGTPPQLRLSVGPMDRIGSMLDPRLIRPALSQKSVGPR